MKMTLRTLAFAAAFLTCAPATLTMAYAQWQTDNHSVPIGKGAGFTGFSGALPGSAGQIFISNGPTADPSFQPAPAAVGVPVGAMFPHSGSAAPTGYLLCAGQTLVRATYAALFAACTACGPGDGSTTFTTPDMRGRTAYGADNMGGTPANRITVAGGNFDATVIGASGGAQGRLIDVTQLPAVAPTFSGGVPAFTGTGQAWGLTAAVIVGIASTVAVTTGGGNNVVVTLAAQNVTTNIITPAGSISAVTGTISPLGNGAVRPQLSPALITTYIIKF